MRGEVRFDGGQPVGGDRREEAARGLGIVGEGHEGRRDAVRDRERRLDEALDTKSHERLLEVREAERRRMVHLAVGRLLRSRAAPSIRSPRCHRPRRRLTWSNTR